MALALSWRDALCGRVHLQEDPMSRGSRVVAVHEWIVVDLPEHSYDARATAAAARAATVVWWALARCPGYGVEENPRFWRRVFDGLIDRARRSVPQPPDLMDAPARKPVEPVDDGTRFFSCPERVITFPRVALRVADPSRLAPSKASDVSVVSAALRVLCSGSAATDHHKESLTRALSKIRRVLSLDASVHHVLPVALDLRADVDARRFEQLLKTIERLQRLRVDTEPPLPVRFEVQRVIVDGRALVGGRNDFHHYPSSANDLARRLHRV